MTGKRNLLPAIVMLVTLALVRLMVAILPPGFSPVYALAFCGGVYFAGAMAWWMPLGVLLVTDIILNVFFYGVAPVSPYMLVSYALFSLLVLLGRQFKPGDHWLKLLGGGLLGAILFYLLSNTMAFFNNPAYAKTLSGWIQALTVGEPGYPPTWTFFRNNLLSSGLFAALFIGSMKMADAPEPKEVEEPEAEPASEAEETKA